ncbi:MAG: VOC family protein [Gammaproteobacteria bacterium]|nr:VOC family protein [Gammaproteobacteria bacterium]
MNNYSHGQFCWIELTAQNWQQAKDFYCNLFGWTAIDQPIGDDLYYTMWQRDGKTVAAMHQATSVQQERGVTTNWLSYIAVDDASVSTVQAKALGAEIIVGPYDVMDAGRMSIIKEPDGAHFAIWQGIKHPGIELRDSENTLCWNELASKNADVSADFYTKLFNWQAADKSMGSVKYTEMTAAGSPQAGIMEMTEEWGDIPPHWMPYFQVESCDDMAKQAEKLGATICVPPTSIPDVGRFSVIQDVQGATFSVITLLET